MVNKHGGRRRTEGWRGPAFHARAPGRSPRPAAGLSGAALFQFLSERFIFIYAAAERNGGCRW